MITQQQIEDKVWKRSAKDVTEHGKYDEGQFTNKKFILDCAATSKFIRKVSKGTRVQKVENHIQTPSGTIKTRQKSMNPILVKTRAPRLRQKCMTILLRTSSEPHS